MKDYGSARHFNDVFPGDGGGEYSAYGVKGLSGSKSASEITTEPRSTVFSTWTSTYARPKYHKRAAAKSIYMRTLGILNAGRYP